MRCTRMTASGKPAAHIYTNADKGSSGAAATAANAWTHLAATYDGANVRIYVNGVHVV